MSENCTWSSTRRRGFKSTHSARGHRLFQFIEGERLFEGGTEQGVGHDICIAMSVHFYFATHWWLHCTVFLLFIFLPFLPPRMFVGDVGAFVGGPAVGFCCAVQYTAQRMRREVDSPVRPREIQGKGREQPRDSKRRAFPQTPSTSLPSSFPRKKEERKRNFSAVVEGNYKSRGPSVPGKGIGGWGKCFFLLHLLAKKTSGKEKRGRRIQENDLV